MLYLQWLVDSQGQRVSVEAFHSEKPRDAGNLEEWLRDRGWSYVVGHWLPLYAAFALETMSKR